MFDISKVSPSILADMQRRMDIENDMIAYERKVEKSDKPIKCVCGGSFKACNKSKHEKSKKHLTVFTKS